jgi:azurin
MTFRSILTGYAAAVLTVGAMAGVQAQAPRVITLHGSDAMKYDITTITAKPGEKLTVKVVSASAMPKVAMAHNFVLLAKGADPAAFTTAAASARATDFVPAAMKDKVIAHTPLAGGNETVEVTFDAPKTPGDYTYLCSFPGHFLAGMKGTLTVK